jgi:hypothetical protein
MDEVSKQILTLVGVGFDNISELNGFIIPREELLSIKNMKLLKP